MIIQIVGLQSQSVALGLFILWAIVSLASATAITAMASRVVVIGSGIAAPGVIVAEVFFPVLVWLCYIHVRPVCFFGIHQGCLLFAFVFYWGVICGRLALNIAMKLGRLGWITSSHQLCKMQLNAPNFINVVAQKLLKRPYKIIVFVGLSYFLWSGPLLLTYDTPLGSVVRLMYRPLVDGCRILAIENIDFPGKIMDAYFDLWFKPEVDPMRCTPLSNPII